MQYRNNQVDHSKLSLRFRNMSTRATLWLETAFGLQLFSVFFCSIKIIDISSIDWAMWGPNRLGNRKKVIRSEKSPVSMLENALSLIWVYPSTAQCTITDEQIQIDDARIRKGGHVTAATMAASSRFFSTRKKSVFIVWASECEPVTILFLRKSHKIRNEITRN